MPPTPNGDRVIRLAYTRADNIPWFLRYLRGSLDKHQQTVYLRLGNDAEDHTSPPTHIVSLCELKEILELLPMLRELCLYGVVLVRCHNSSHDADPSHHGGVAPNFAQNLRILILHRLAITSPFDVDPLKIVELVPQLRTLTISSCYALPATHGIGTTDISETLPHFVYPPVPVFPTYFRTLKLAYPDRVERERYGMLPPWYDFSRGLPLERGTVRMELNNVHDECIPSIRELLDDDSATLEELRVEFGHDFQNSSWESWNRLGLDECYHLHKVELHLPVRFIQDYVNSDDITHPLSFVTIGSFIRQLPSGVLAIALELDMVDSHPDDKLYAIGAVPWAVLDEHLTNHLRDAVFSIHLATDWPIHMRSVVRGLIRSLMANSVERGKVLLKPGRSWPEDIPTTFVKWR